MLTNSQDLIGHTLGTCTLRRLLGRGGMGAVYLAHQSRPRRIVAVKVLLPNLVEDHPRDEFLARFRREADAVAALDHINIMPIYEYGEQGEIAYLVMPHVTGGTLRDRLEKTPIPPLETTVQIIEQAAAGLDSAHSLGIIHRDLKPGNMLFHADGRILLADFGLAKVLKETAEDSGLSLVTNTGTIVGTPEYLSPEQGTGDTLDPRTDVYSLGVVLYQMLAGRVPFGGTSPVAIAIKHTLEVPPPITRFNPQVPRSVEAVVMKALAKKPDERFTTAGEFARALRLAASSEHETHIWQAPAPHTNEPSPLVIPPVEAPPAPAKAQPNEGHANQSPRPRKQQPQKHKAAEDRREQALQDQLTTLPTVLMNTGNEQDPHEALTEEAPRLPEEESSVPLQPTMITSADPAVVTSSEQNDDAEPQTEQPPPETTLDVPMPVIHKPERVLEARVQPESAPVTRQPEPVMEARVLADQRQVMAPALPRPVEQPYARVTSVQGSQGIRSRKALLIGSVVLALLIIVTSVVMYNMQSHGQQNNGHPITQKGATQTQQTSDGTTATSTSQTQSTPKVVATPDLKSLPTPPPGVHYGPLVYGSPKPSCTQHDGTWSKTGSATYTCAKDGVQVVNNGNQRAGLFLHTTPTGQPIPDDFTIQVQVTINPGSHGSFGIFYRSQSDDHRKAYAYIIEPDGTWTAYVYVPDSGRYDPLTPPISIFTAVKDTLTIDIQVHNFAYDFFVNGNTNLGGAYSGEQYASGTVGLAIDPGANVTFKNLAVYTYPG